MPAKPTKPKTAFGQRLVDAFKSSYQTDDRDLIAQTIGFANRNSLYGVLSGKQELGFDALIKFRQATNHTIDWLLTGEEPRFTNQKGSKVVQV